MDDDDLAHTLFSDALSPYCCSSELAQATKEGIMHAVQDSNISRK
jgi:hypothetical protein